MKKKESQTDVIDSAQKKGSREDASRWEVMLYAFGNIEAAIADQFFIILQTVMVVAMHVNPLLIGLILGVKTLWDGVTDPVMAHITDNTRSRWGRRRPYILVGGVSRIALLVVIIGFMPKGAHLTSNVVMEAQKFANEGVSEAKSELRAIVQINEQVGDLDAEGKEKLLNMAGVLSADAAATRLKLENNLPTLEEALAHRQEDQELKKQEFERQFQALSIEENKVYEAYTEYTAIRKSEGLPYKKPSADDLVSNGEIPQGVIDAEGISSLALEKSEKIKGLISNSSKAQRQAIAAGYVALYVAVKEGVVSYEQVATPTGAQQAANQVYAAEDLAPLNIFDTPPTKIRVWQGTLKKQWAIATQYAAYSTLMNDVQLSGEVAVTPGYAQSLANQAFATVDLEPLDIFTVELSPTVIQAKRESMAQSHLDLYTAVTNGVISYDQVATAEGAQLVADKAFSDAGVPSLDIFSVSPEKMRFWQGKLKKQWAIARQYLAYHVVVNEGAVPEGSFDSPEYIQALADQAYEVAGFASMDVVSYTPPVKKRKSAMDNIKAGLAQFSDPQNMEQRKLIIYVLFAFLLFTTLTTVQSVPYYALGIELSPSYNGRTQVVTYRAIMNQIAGLVQPWVPVFCFSLIFSSALKGLFWISIFACVIGIPSTVLMCWFTKERTDFAPKKKDHPNLFKSMWGIANNLTFLRIFSLYTVVGVSIGVFMSLGLYLNIYWVMGSALSGAKLGAMIGMLAWGLGLIMLPVINWACRRFEKHRFLRFALVWMATGAALHWFCLNPEHPEYQFILPFFYSVGIGSVFTVLPTLMADVTDLDELNHGLRREGMFGAVMAFLMKLMGTLTPILSGVVLVSTGFDAALEYEQLPSTIFKLRIMYSFVPACVLLSALIILVRYPLTRERVMEIKETIRKRHEVAAAEEKTEA